MLSMHRIASHPIINKENMTV